jgi:predicted hotdog family 3-hydroxylacyl-ACP dehydratase
MSQSSPAPFLRDPITVPRKELIEHYRAQAARYRQLAEREDRPSVREGLLDLARQCDAMANTLAAPRADQSAKPELSKDEILLLLSQVIAEKKSVPIAAVMDRPQSLPEVGAVRELSLDEILQKIQRDIAEGDPLRADPSGT